MGKNQRNHRVSINELRKAKAYIKLNLPSSVKDSKKGVFEYISNLRERNNIVRLLLNELGGPLVREKVNKTRIT